MASAVTRSTGLATTLRTKQPTSFPVQFTRCITRDALAQEQYKRSMAFQLKRDWKTGDVYAPHDLSAAEMRKWGRKKRPNADVFDILNLNPLSLYKNFSVMSDFVSDMGRIRPITETGLRRVNQRKIAKAVRRAIALGLMPSVHRHPEIIKRQRETSARPF